MICDLAPGMILYPSVARRQVYQEPYGEISVYPDTDYYFRREIDSYFIPPRYNSFNSRSQVLVDAAQPVMLVESARRLTDLYRREKARVMELQARNRLLQLQNFISEIDATLYERRRPYRYGNFNEYGISHSEPAYIPVIVKCCVNDETPSKSYVKSTIRTSGKEGTCQSASKHDSNVDTKLACECKKSKSEKKSNNKEAHVEAKTDPKIEKSKLKPVSKSNEPEVADYETKEDPEPEESKPVVNSNMQKDGIEVKAAPAPKEKKPVSKSNDPKASELEKKEDPESEDLKPVVNSNMQKDDVEAKTGPSPKELNSVEKLNSEQLTETPFPQEPSVGKNDSTDEVKSTRYEKTKKEDVSGHHSESSPTTQGNSPVSEDALCALSRCPSIEEVEDEEFKNWKSN